MNYVRKSRRSFVFTTTDLSLNIEKDGVRIQDGKATFPLEKFKDKDECLKWITDNLDENVKINKAQGGQTKGLEVTPFEFDLIKEYMRSPDDFAAEDVRIYQDMLCNNLPDRDSERFMPDTLKRFVETLPGKQRLLGHNWNVKGNGRYYDAKLVKMNVDDAVAYFGKKYPAKNARKVFQKIVDLDGAVMWVEGKFYIPSFTFDSIEMDMGIGGDSSIGFSGVERRLYEDGDFRVIELHPREDCEALEGSDVGVPAQPGAGTKEFGPDNDGNASAERTETPNNGGKSMNFEVKAFDLEMPVTEEGLENDIKSIADAVELKAVEMQSNIDVLTSDNDSLKEEVKALKDDVETKAAEFESVKAIADELKSDLVEQLITKSLLAGLFENKPEEVESRRKIYSGRSVKELKMDIETAEKAMKNESKSRVQGGEVEDEVKSVPIPAFAGRLG